MPQFLLIDHSLSGPGSHHYEYATHILQAAGQLGFDPLLASNRRFRMPTGPSPSFRLFPLFRYNTYGGNTLAKPNRPRQGSSDCDTLSASWQQWRDQFQGWRRERRQQRRIQSFRQACGGLMQQLELKDGDHVFLPTLSECDFLALSGWLQDEPTTRRAQWHLQFHFDFLEGRPPDYCRQLDRIAQMRGRFELALRGLRHHRLKFYSTTLEMADQYNRLGVAQFDWLPYPVNSAFRPNQQAADAQHGRLRAVCAGRVRDEKGSAQLAQLVAELGPRLLSTGRLQLLVQGRARRLRRLLNHPLASCSLDQLMAGTLPDAPILQIPFPLPLEAYACLIRQADLGLFLYDSYRYYARCSGVLVEMLSCGTPVIVPAGCWLAEEIREADQAYLAWLCGELPTLDEWRGSSLRVVTAPQQMLSAWEISPAASLISLAMRAGQEAEVGSHVRWEITQSDSRGTQVSSWQHVHKSSPPGQVTHLAIPVEPQAARLSVSCQSAYDQRPLEIAELRLRSHTGRRGPAAARSAVGLTAADPSQAGRLVGEMVQQFEHYRATARAFSNSYRAVHQARVAVQQLVAPPAATEDSRVA